MFQDTWLKWRPPWARPLPQGKELVKEAERLGVTPHETWTGGEARTVIDEAELQRRVIAARADQKNTLQVIAIIASLAISTSVAVWSLHSQSVRTSGELMLKFEDRIYQGGSRAVAIAFDRDKALSSRADISDDDIEEFLGNYELLAIAYQHSLISRGMAYAVFSGDLETAFRDQRFRRLLCEDKREESDYWAEVFYLAKQFKIKNLDVTPDCQPASPSTHKPP